MSIEAAPFQFTIPDMIYCSSNVYFYTSAGILFDISS